MATTTQTVRRPVLNPSRTHDYLYDPLYTMSSERDHARAMFRSQTNVNRIKRVPNFPQMFSELRHFPKAGIQLETVDPVPKFVSRRWRGYADQAREELVRYKTFNYDPTVNLPGVQYERAEVTGHDRFKYFRRPIIPYLQQVPPEVLLQSTTVDPLAPPEAMLERSPTPATRTVGIQTVYRDSEVQTDPYTPEYVIRPGSAPELLTLATLSWGHGLPAGLAEVEMIERARAKRAWEAELPPLNDTDQLEKRRQMMDQMETHEWQLREQEIEKLQEARLELLKRMLREREEQHVELNTKRLDRLWTKKQIDRENHVRAIRKEHIKAIRKLTKKRQAVEGRLEKRNLIQDYVDHGSQVYAPMTRVGIFLDRGSEQYNVKNRYISTYEGLLELERSLPDFVLQPRIRAPRQRTLTRSGFIKRSERRERELAEIHDIIKSDRLQQEQTQTPLKFLQRVEKPVERPPTPSVEIPPQLQEDRHLAAIFLQQVVRGRAVQNMIYEGKEKRMELIRELRSTHALQEAEQQMKKADKQATRLLQRQRQRHEHQESQINEHLSALEGSAVGDMFDFLSKELIRLQEERRIHAFSMLAERERRIREAEESGRRQEEERRRREQDETFKQVMKIHQSSVDTYLEDIILSTVDITANDQSRVEVHETASIINDVAYDIEERRDQLQSEEIVADMVHGFLLPEVRRLTTQERIQLAQRKHLLAAHHIIHDEGERVEDPAGTERGGAGTIDTETVELGTVDTEQGGAGTLDTATAGVVDVDTETVPPTAPTISPTPSETDWRADPDLKGGTPVPPPQTEMAEEEGEMAEEAGEMAEEEGEMAEEAGEMAEEEGEIEGEGVEIEGEDGGVEISQPDDVTSSLVEEKDDNTETQD